MLAQANSGDTRISHVGFGVPPKRTFLNQTLLPRLQAYRTIAIARTRSPARETRVLPRSSVRNARGSALTTPDYVEKNRTALRGSGRAKRWDGTRTGGELSACGHLVCAS